MAQSHQGTALMTGASSGLGAVYADRLAHRGYDLVMSASDMVDAAFKGFDRRELVTIPSLHAGEKWDTYEAARRAMSTHLSSDVPAPRYATAR